MRIGQDRRQAGDTLIEVLVAMAVLGAIITIAYSVMNRGFAAAQNSLDRTNTQNVVNGQVSLLRAAHKRFIDGNASYWNAITAKKITGTANPDGCSSTDRTRAFYFDMNQAYNPLNPTPTGPLAPQAYSLPPTPLERQGTTAVPGDGIWIEAYQESTNSYLFYVKSCWNVAYGDGGFNQRQLKTVVRLYVP